MGTILKTEAGKKALDYHRGALYDGHPLLRSAGKICILPTKQCDTQEELSMAYTPLVGACVEAIAEDPGLVGELTGYGNKGLVLSNGTAILGYGDLGPRAATPVMEGKSILFKVFGDVNMDAVMVELRGVDELVDFAMACEPTYAGINLEDISAPACFDIEEKLQEKYRGFVFHDDQHGTAVISLGGLYNALEIIGKDIADVRIVINGAGAASIASAKLYRLAGARDVVMLDSKGVLYEGRPFPSNKHKDGFARSLSELGMRKDAKGIISLAEALRGAHVFVGCSVGGVLTGGMVEAMADEPAIMAMANPVPEIDPAEAKAAGAKVVATGRSDYPNQINNVLGFPGIFRGALDALIGRTTDDAKLAAAMALRRLAHEPVPEALWDKYPRDRDSGVFEGRDPVKPEFIVPLALDVRVPVEVAAAVYKSAFDGGIARAGLPGGFASVDEYLPVYKKEVAARIEAQARLRALVAEGWQ